MKKYFENLTEIIVTNEMINPSYKKWKKDWENSSLKLDKTINMKKMFKQYSDNCKTYSLSGMQREIDDIQYVCLFVELLDNDSLEYIAKIVGKKELEYLEEHFELIGIKKDDNTNKEIPVLINKTIKTKFAKDLNSIYY